MSPHEVIALMELNAEMVAALAYIRSIARNEQEHPIGLTMTAFAIIEKHANAALAKSESS